MGVTDWTPEADEVWEAGTQGGAGPEADGRRSRRYSTSRPSSGGGRRRSAQENRRDPILL